MTLIGQRRAASPSAAATAPWFDSLAEAWQAMNDLRGTLPSPTRNVRSAALTSAIEIVTDALYLPGPSGQRRVPSAGAIFPYTTMVLANEEHGGLSTGWSLFQVSSDGRVSDVPVEKALTSGLAQALHPAADEGVAHLLLLNRPWMSIRKYGPRGYLYSRLDAAHALVNLLGIALERGTAWLRLNCGGYEVENLLSGHAPYHELAGVVSVRGEFTTSSTTVEAIKPHAPAIPAKPLARDLLEATCWSLLGERVSPAASAGPAVGETLLHTGLPSEGQQNLRLAGRWSRASAMRRSARSFDGRPLDAEQIKAPLSALGTELPMNLQPGGASAMEVTVFVADPVDSDITLDRLLGRYGRVVTARRTDRAAIAAACMGQQQLREAQAFVLVTASRSRLLYHGRAEFEEALFRAGAGGQLMYLGASRAGVGITTIGGFDPVRWAELAGLPKDHELLYLAALGNEAAVSVPKLDRDAPAVAHGER